MFRLLKLMAFALFGYALYEFVRGMNAGATGAGGGQRAFGMGGGSSESAFGNEARSGQLTGPGMGREDETLDPDGGSVRRRVGRGAVGM